jgi:hypothetical protein
MLAAAPAAAQRPETLVRVRVVDTADAPVVSAEVSAVHGLNTVLVRATTDWRGSARIMVARDGDEMQIAVRRLGFQRGAQFIHPDKDSLVITIRLQRTATELAPVHVTAQEDIKRKHFHIGADEIEASPRPIVSGLDVITKLRPDMMDPPGGNGLRWYNPYSGKSASLLTRCGMYNVWINGERIVYPPIDQGVALKAIAIRQAQMGAWPHIGPSGLGATPIDVQSALERIRPEHIDEITYLMCGDTTVNRANGDNAVYVTLKPGVKYDMVRGSYVVSTATYESSLATLEAPPPPAAAATFRSRLLGVFDIETGDPIAAVRITDVTSGTYAMTTSTGTVSLAFLPEGTSTIQLRHTAYGDTTMQVTISAKDTLPLTLVLARRK